MHWVAPTGCRWWFQRPNAWPAWCWQPASPGREGCSGCSDGRLHDRPRPGSSCGGEGGAGPNVRPHRDASNDARDNAACHREWTRPIGLWRARRVRSAWARTSRQCLHRTSVTTRHDQHRRWPIRVLRHGVARPRGQVHDVPGRERRRESVRSTAHDPGVLSRRVHGDGHWHRSTALDHCHHRCGRSKHGRTAPRFAGGGLRQRDDEQRNSRRWPGCVGAEPRSRGGAWCSRTRSCFGLGRDCRTGDRASNPDASVCDRRTRQESAVLRES